MADMIRYFGKAEGRVQGVGFRMYVQQHAIDLGITGWVRNMEDGTVDMELQGEQAAIDKLEDVIRAGNYFIHVTAFSLEAKDVVPSESGFKIRY
ncbi:MAG: acylphosphatase [Selenomonadaceae bacterium]|nr:acylphosphatase [Selenomonadaceae bacterium]